MGKWDIGWNGLKQAEHMLYADTCGRAWRDCQYRCNVAYIGDEWVVSAVTGEVRLSIGCMRIYAVGYGETTNVAYTG